MNNKSLNMERAKTNTTNYVLQTVLLKDVFEAIKSNVVPKPLTVLMKIDIEHFECRAFLGSPEILRQNQDVKLLAVIMEWTFEGQNGKYSEQCPKDKVISLAKLFLMNGFTPFQLNSIENSIHARENDYQAIVYSMNNLPAICFQRYDIVFQFFDWNDLIVIDAVGVEI